MDRELAAEIAEHARDASLIDGRVDGYGEGDESEYGGGRSEGSWSFAR